MSNYKSKHTGAQVDEAVSKVLNGEVGGGGATPDWNAQPGDAGYIENRTHYVTGTGVDLKYKTLDEVYIPDTIARKSDIPVPIIINYNTIKDAANSEVNTISEQTWLKYIANDTYKNYDWIIQRDGIKYNCTVIPDYDNEHIQILYFTRNEIEGTSGPLGNAIMKYSGLRIQLLPYTKNTYLIYKISNGGSLETREFVFGETYNKNAYLIAAAQMSGIDTIDCKWVYTKKDDSTITVNGQHFHIENSITNVDAIFSVKDKSLTYVDGNGLINKVTFADNGRYDISKNNLGISSPNWNAQPGEAGYIENKPFYKIATANKYSCIFINFDGSLEISPSEKIYADNGNGFGYGRVANLYFFDGIMHHHNEKIPVIRTDDPIQFVCYDKNNLTEKRYTISFPDMYKGQFDLILTPHHYEIPDEFVGYYLTVKIENYNAINYGRTFTFGPEYVLDQRKLDISNIESALSYAPQTLFNNEKNQALVNLGIDPVALKYTINPLVINYEDIQAGEDIKLPEDLANIVLTDGKFNQSVLNMIIGWDGQGYYRVSAYNCIEDYPHPTISCGNLVYELDIDSLVFDYQ